MSLQHRRGKKHLSLGADAASQTVHITQTGSAFPFGAAISRRLVSNEAVAQFVAQNFNWAVFGNESKWYSNEPVPEKENYSAADHLLDWCEAHHLQVRGHCVLWEPAKWQPRWVQNLAGEELRTPVERRIAHAVTHYKGRFKHWDVINEMMHGLFYQDHLGLDYRAHVYKRVRELDADVKLFTNDFNVLSIDQDFSDVQTVEYVEQIKALRAQGAPIDGVGIQGHCWHEDLLKTPHVVKQRLDLVASLGLPIWITEFDVAHDDDQKNADIVELIYRTCFEHPMVEGIVTWMPWAGDSWRGPHMGMLDQSGKPKPEGERYLNLRKEWTTSTRLTADRHGDVTVEGFKGDYVAQFGQRTVPFKVS